MVAPRASLVKVPRGGAVNRVTPAFQVVSGVEGEEDFIGAGVHFCSTCDGPFYKGKQVAVVGGGNSATDEAIGLLRFADHVTMLVRGEQLKASKVAIDKATSDERITTRYNTTVTRLGGNEGKLNMVHIQDKLTGATEVLHPDGLFVFIGQQPNTGFLKDSGVLLDESGFVLTGHHLARHPGWSAGREPDILETRLPGVFAAGDVRTGSTRQVASAAGEGATAALLIHEYLNSH